MENSETDLRTEFTLQLENIKKNFEYKERSFSEFIIIIRTFISSIALVNQKLDLLLQETLQKKSSNFYQPLYTVLEMIFKKYKLTISEFTKQLTMITPVYEVGIRELQKVPYTLKDISAIEKEYLDELKEVSVNKKNYLKECEKVERKITNDTEISDEQRRKGKMEYGEWENLGEKGKYTSSKIAEGHYINSFKNLEIKRSEYNKKVGKCLKDLKETDKNTIEICKMMVRSILTSWKGKVSREDKLREDSQNEFDSLDCSSLVNNEKYFTLVPVGSQKFEQYEFQFLHTDKYLTNKYNKSINRNIHQTIIDFKKELMTVAPSYDTKIEENKLKLSDFCEDFFNGTTVDSNFREKIVKICSYFLSKELRLHFLLYLNTRRAEGQFEIKSIEWFKSMGEIMSFIVQLVGDEHDLETLKFVLILAQTYYIMNSENERIYLIRYFEDHPLFQEQKFWEYYYRTLIDHEFAKIPIDDPEHGMRLKNNLVFSKIMSSTHNMMEFIRDKDKICEIVKVFCKKFELDEENTKVIESILEEIKYDAKPKMDDNLILKKIIKPEDVKKK